MTRRVKLIFGLGNEGEEYALTRHNIGKYLVSHLFKKPSRLNFSLLEKWGGLYLATNLTFVNNSGKSISELKEKLRLKPEEILVIHDDADLIFPLFKISFGSGSAGHKGVESIFKALKTKDIWRWRFGINKKSRQPAMELVLKKWTGKELQTLKKIAKKLPTIFKILEKRLPNELNLAKDYFCQ